MEKLNVAILIFDDVEVLDFAGPFEVFSRTRLEPGPLARRSDDSAPFQVFLVAKTDDLVTATGGLQVLPHYSFEDAPPIDLLVVPGGFGTRPLLEDQQTLDWVRTTAQRSRLTTSVCTGSLVYARLGMLAGKRATTHWAVLDELAKLDPSIAVQPDERVVDDGIITSAGVSSGIDMAFYVVERLFGREVADDTARYMEYPRQSR